MPLYNPITISGNISVGNIDASGDITASTGAINCDSLSTTAAISAGTNVLAPGYVGLTQMADPGAPTSNTISVHARDNGGSSTLGLRCEQAVAVDVVAASTHTLTVLINNTAYKILLST
jgi:hypothetical protein